MRGGVCIDKASQRHSGARALRVEEEWSVALHADEVIGQRHQRRRGEGEVGGTDLDGLIIHRINSVLRQPESEEEEEGGSAVSSLRVQLVRVRV